MQQLLYIYDQETHEYLRSVPATLDARASKRCGTPVFFETDNGTLVPPPEERTGYVAIFDQQTNTWSQKRSYKGQTVYKVTDGSDSSTWDTSDALSDDVTVVPPPESHPEFYIFKKETEIWIFNESKKEELCSVIWELRKQLRDIRCNMDIEYHGHLFHVDKVSLNDIMLAAQDAIVTGDLATTRRWVTADDEDTDVSGQDLVNILKAYGDRRSRLVYESNDAWRSDLELSGEELLALYDDLTSQIEQFGGR